ncbi:unnamed protein product [Adineta steineri]|uniref:Uncharacterized protein n=1 Tax=Adineta steineri TaxID=433720 RepID=A0A815JZC9_9BILA|nr:unnamed protein product [Adineta steineri]
MPFKRKVHVLSEEDTTITTVRGSTSGTILSSLRFKIPVITVIILLFVASIVIPIVLVIRSNDKTSSSSFSTTEGNYIFCSETKRNVRYNFILKYTNQLMKI